VAAEATARRADDARRVGGAQAQVARPERHRDVVAQRSLAVGHGLVDDVGHARVALDARHGGGLDAAHPHVGHEVGEDDLLDAGLAERRQHPLDVPEEHPVRPDDEHALVLEREAVRVQEVRGPVERDDGLAGAGAALHHQHAGVRRPDDLVLLGLDRGDDVAEGARAPALDRREQRAVPPQSGSVGLGEPLVVADTEMALAEQLVLDAEQLRALDGEVSTAGKPHGLATGRAVERLGDGGAPVDHDGIARLVGHREAADVEALERVR
jgi:hypothetical protein